MEYKTPKDEILGLTSYLHEANRPRKPEEYINYWKHRQRAISIAKKLGYKNWTLEEVLYEIESLRSEQKTMRDEASRLEEELCKTHQSIDDLEKKGKKLANDARELLRTKDIAIKTRLSTLDKVFEYGGHKDDCAWIEVCNSGRVVRGATEANTCSCGWYAIEAQLKVDPRYKKDYETEEKKPKNSIRELEID